MHKLYLAFAQKIERHFRIDARYFLSGGFWLLVAQATTVLSSLIVTVFLTRMLTENDFGIYRYVIGIGVLLSALSLTGIGQAILQASAKGLKGFLWFSTPITLKYSLLISLSALIGSGYYFYNGNSTLGIGCLLIAILQPLPQLFLNTLGHLHGEGKFKLAAQIQTYKAVFVSGTTLCVLLLTQNIITLLITYFVTQALAAVLIYLKYKPKYHIKTNIAPEISKQYLSYAKHTSVRNLLTGTAQRLDTVIIFQQLGAAPLALYTVATLIPDQIKGSFKNMQTLLIPKYSKHDSLRTIRASIPKRSLQFLVLLMVLTFFFVLIVPYIYTLLFPNYLEAVPIVQLLALAFPASIYLLPLGAMQAHQLEKSLYLFNSFTSVLQIILLLSLVVVFGMMGAILAKIVGQYVTMILAFVLLYRDTST